MIDTNVRAVKSEEVDGKRIYALSVNRPLCTHCARQADCKALRSAQRLSSKYKVGAMIRTCRDYLYPILFVDPKGTEGKFNTIRLGTAWLNRLQEGDVVGLIDKQDTLFGTARVTDIFAGERDWIVRDYAYENHLYVDSGMTQQEAGADLAKKLPTIYGNLIVKNNTEATVIYLENCGSI